jgi:hypothetical protein
MIIWNFNQIKTVCSQKMVIIRPLGGNLYISIPEEKYPLKDLKNRIYPLSTKNIVRHLIDGQPSTCRIYLNTFRHIRNDIRYFDWQPISSDRFDPTPIEQGPWDSTE